MDDARRDAATSRLPTGPASRRALLGVLAGGAFIALAEHGILGALASARPQVIVPVPAPAACMPTATSGIAGLVLLGPVCPVVTQDNPCPDRPFAATLVVRDAQGHEVCSTRGGDDGRFRIGLPPGSYELVPVNGVAGLPHASAQPVTVAPNQYTEVLVSYDSGIR